MSSAYQLFTFRGIPIRVHTTTLIFLLVFAIVTNPGGGPSGFLLALVLLALIFGFVLLHELGHSLVAIYHGIQVKDITLYPLGGIARLARMPRKPSTEIQIAIAGPLVNFALAGLFTLLRQVFSLAILEPLIFFNLVLALFNLLPAFPLDGGRIFRALLGTRMSYTRATQIAARTGQGVALVLGLVGLLTPHFMLILIAVFIFLAAQAELTTVRWQDRLSRSPPIGGEYWTQRLKRSWPYFRQDSGLQAGDVQGEKRPADESVDQDRLVIDLLPDGTVRRYVRR